MTLNPDGSRRYPLSAMQHAMVTASLRAPDSGVYVLQADCQLSEEVDPNLLRRAWDAIVDRHSALRTRFLRDPAEGLWQVVSEHAPCRWLEEDWRDIQPGAQAARIPESLETDRRHRTQPLGDLPMQVRLILLGATEARLIWTLHHAVIDGRTMVTVLRKVFELYDAWGRGETAQLSSIRPLTDHIEWLSRQDFSQSENYWRSYLEGYTGSRAMMKESLQLRRPGDRELSRHNIQFSESTAAELKSFADEHGFTLNTLIQGAWALLLSRYSGRDDVLFGAVRAVRRSGLPGTEETVGPLMTTVPIRVRIEPREKPADFLRRIRERWLSMRAHEHTPLSSIQEWGGLRAPYESIIVLDRQDIGTALAAQCGPWANRKVRLIQATDIPLTLSGFTSPTLQLEITGDTRHYPADSMAQMIEHLRNLLHGFLRAGESEVSGVRMLTPVERQRIVTEWNSAGNCPKLDIRAHQLIERQAREAPHEPAVHFADQVLSFGDLDEQANRLARYLRGQGVGPETIVGLCLPRCPELVIAVLAVLKAGGAFLPLDPDEPRRRLIGMAEESGAVLVLTVRGSGPDLTASGVRTVALDEQADDIAQHPATALPDHGSLDDAAYIIYTSGSSGRPKGVVIEHRGLVAHTLALKEACRIVPGDRRLQLTSIGGDVFVSDVFTYLAGGGSVVLPEEIPASAPELLRLIDRTGVTIVGVPSSLWSELATTMADDPASIPPSLRLVICGSEQVSPGSYRCWKDKLSGNMRWLNAYGPTEASITATVYEGGTSRYDEDGFVPIGKPLANYEIHVLDWLGDSVPVGVAGEICIGGPGVARGYLNRPEETERKFIRHPELGTRLYRTGDRGFYLPDGNLVFLGRADSQVQIGGYRVEPEEVEAVLAEHPGVGKAAVTVQGENRVAWLAAYTTPAGDQPPSEDELLSHLKSRLPAYMVPKSFTDLREMPLTPSGKIDRNRLPAPQRRRVAGGRNKPRSPVQRRLAAYWTEVFGVKEAGLGSDFLEDGGDSISAFQLLGRIYRGYGIELPIRALFENTTFENLAAEIKRRQSDTG